MEAFRNYRAKRQRVALQKEGQTTDLFDGVFLVDETIFEIGRQQIFQEEFERNRQLRFGITRIKDESVVLSYAKSDEASRVEKNRD